MRGSAKGKGVGRKGMGVKGNAFRELTLVAGPNVSDGFLFSFFFSSSSLDRSSPSRCISRTSRSAAGSSWIQRGVLWAPTNERTGEKVRAVLRFVFSVPGIAN